jgi:hypothetical protein
MPPELCTSSIWYLLLGATLQTFGVRQRSLPRRATQRSGQEDEKPCSQMRQPFSKPLPSELLHDHHGAVAVLAHAIRRAAQEEPCDSRVSLSSNDDQVHAFGLCKTDDFVGSMAADDYAA